MKNKQKRNYDAAAIDMNGILHVSLKSARSWGAFYGKTMSKVKALLSHVNAPLIGFFFDGPAPLAKLEEQIRRRRGQRVDQERFISTVAITPGSIPMTKMEKGLHDRLHRLAKERNVDIHISNSMEVGEGEIKMIKWINDLDLEEDSPVTLIGGDADLILIGACMPKVSVDILRSDVNTNYLHALDVQKTIELLKIRKLDFVCISMFLGNDYLPKLPQSSYEALMKVSQLQVAPLVNSDGALSIEGLLEFLRLFYKLHKYDIDRHSNTENSYDAAEYLKGLAWCCRMYICGECPDYEYSYDFDGCPNVRQLIEYLENCPKEPIQWSKSGNRALFPDEILLLTMPRGAKEYLPPYLRHVVDSPELSWWYPEPCDECTVLKADVARCNQASEKVNLEKGSRNNEAKNAARAANKALDRHRSLFHPPMKPPIEQVRQFVKDCQIERKQVTNAKSVLTKKIDTSHRIKATPKREEVYPKQEKPDISVKASIVNEKASRKKWVKKEKA